MAIFPGASVSVIHLLGQKRICRACRGNDFREGTEKRIEKVGSVKEELDQLETNLQKIPCNRWSGRIKRIGALHPLSRRERRGWPFVPSPLKIRRARTKRRKRAVFAPREPIGPKRRNSGPVKPRKIECAAPREYQPPSTPCTPLSHFALQPPFYLPCLHVEFLCLEMRKVPPEKFAYCLQESLTPCHPLSLSRCLDSWIRRYRETKAAVGQLLPLSCSSWDD